MGRKSLKILFAFAIILLIIFSCAITKTEAATKSIIIKVGDKEFDYNPSKTYALQTALQDALTSLKDTGGTVTVSGSGEIHIKKSLYIYSNTTLDIKSSTSNKIEIIADKNMNPMLTTEASVKKEAKGYNGWNNITVSGGTWNANKKAGQAFKFRHGTDLTIKNLVAEQSKGHTINVSASKNVTISYVTIKHAYTNDITTDRNDPTKDDFKPFSNREVIHLDYAGSGESIYKDGTAVKNVTIDHCIFDNVPCAIGNHVAAKKITDIDGNVHSKETAYGKDITISNCTFKNISNYGINLCSHKNVTITGSIFEGTTKGKAFIRYYSETLKENSASTINTEGYETAFKKEDTCMKKIKNAIVIVADVKYNGGQELRPLPIVTMEEKILTIRARLCNSCLH